MAIDQVTIARADDSDREVILEILSQADLPIDGVAEIVTCFLVARRGASIVGCIGLERHGDLALLRSAAVRPEYRSEGVGSLLVAHLLSQARADGVTEVALLTTTAKDYFQKRFGFVEAQRSDYQSPLEKSVEWNLPRCSSASFLTLRLDD
jgi:amino-acid N-acetyltransferase